MNNRHPWPLKKSKSWGPFWSYQLNSTANAAYPPRKWAKWAKLAVLFSQPQTPTCSGEFENHTTFFYQNFLVLKMVQKNTTPRRWRCLLGQYQLWSFKLRNQRIQNKVGFCLSNNEQLQRIFPDEVMQTNKNLVNF